MVRRLRCLSVIDRGLPPYRGGRSMLARPPFSKKDHMDRSCDALWRTSGTTHRRPRGFVVRHPSVFPQGNHSCPAARQAKGARARAEKLCALLHGCKPNDDVGRGRWRRMCAEERKKLV